MDSPAPAAARRLAREHGRAVRVLLSREDVVRLGPKRPPVAAGVRADGTGVMRVVRTPGVADAVAAMAPGLVVEEVDVAGPPTSAAVRGAGWVEAAVLLAAAGAQSANRPRPASRPHPAGGLRGYGALWLDLAAGEATAQITAPSGGRAAATVRLDGAGGPAAVSVAVAAGDPLDEVVLRSYAVGAAHMALGWVFSEAVAVDGDGEPEDLTIRSFGILRARDTPEVDVTIDPSDAAPAAASDAVFAAVAAAAWGAQGLPARWPTRRPHR
jgi:CO/xanthine dehydrogenase Mo-binding subunit